MQTFNQIVSGESGLSVRGKLNNVLTSIIAGSEGINSIWAKIASLIQMIKAMDGGVGGLIKDTSYDPSDLDPYKSCVLVSLITGTFNNLKDASGVPITIEGVNTISIFYRAENSTYWEYDTEEITPAVDSYKSSDATRISGRDSHVLTRNGIEIKPLTDFDSVFNTDGKSLTEINKNLSEQISLNVFAVEMDEDTGDLIAITEEDGNVTSAGITDDGDIYADWEF